MPDFKTEAPLPSRPPKIRAGMGVLAGLSVLLFLAASAEILSLGVFWYRYGQFYYSYRAAQGDAPPAAAPQQIAEAVFHPYFAYINRAGRTGEGWGTNNVGFQVHARLLAEDPRCCDLPLKPGPNEVIVGVFGGSVGAGFGLGAQGSGRLGQLLQAIPRFQERTVRIVNLAMAGFRQPQQVMTLAWFLSLGQRFDVVINIDGFNEIVTSIRNHESGVEPMYPADTLWGAWGRDIEKAGRSIDSMGEDALLARLALLRVRNLARAREGCSLAACYLWLSARIAWTRRRDGRSVDEIDPVEHRSSLFPTLRQSFLGDDARVFDYIAARWSDSSRIMAGLSAQAGAIYLHVLQPNQWDAAAGGYQPTAVDHIYKWVIGPVNEGYPRLRKQMESLRADGILVWDASLAFRGLPNRQVYSDDCCHYTDAGYDILFTGAAGRLAARLAVSGAMGAKQ